MAAVRAWALALGGILAITGGLGAYKYMSISGAIAAAAQMPEHMETVEVTTASQGTWSANTRAVGTVVATRRAELRNELAGTVREVGFKSGDVVDAGRVLVRLDVSEEQAQLAAARAEAELARLTLERRQRLVRTQAMSAAELDQAQATLQANRAQVDRVEAIIAKKTLTAPFRARLGISDLQPGQYLSEGTLITTLQGVEDDAYVDFRLAQDEAVTIRPGSTVTLDGPQLPQGTVTATVQAVDSAVDDGSRTVRVRSVAAGMGEVLRPGSFVDVTAVTAQPRPSLFIPLTAVRRAPFGDQVYVVVTAEENGQPVQRAKARFVKLGPIRDGQVAVLDGLQAGEPVAAAGSFKLRDGMKVQTVPAASPSVADTAAPGVVQGSPTNP